MEAKQRAGEWASAQVKDGMSVGLGTGSTAAFFIRALARRVKEEKMNLRLISSSFSTAILAGELGLTLLPFEDVVSLDLYADGADEVDPEKRLIKGRGAAMVREKILVHISKRFLVLVDPSKCVKRLGTHFPVPVECLPIAHRLVRRELESQGALVVMRMATEKDGPVVTDQGNFVLDARYPAAIDLAGLDGAIDAIPGVVGHGLFTRYADRIDVVIGHSDRVEILP